MLAVVGRRRRFLQVKGGKGHFNRTECLVPIAR